MLKCKNVAIKFDNMTVLDKVSFEVKQGDYLFIIGENGSGKTSLVKAILGLIPISDGQIECDGEGIGYLSQQTPVQNDFPASVFEIALSGFIKKCGLFYTRQQKQLALDKLKKMGIEDIKHRCFRELSGGMRQRVLLARALCASERLLILDEPMTGLDCGSRAELYKNLSALHRQGTAVIMISHDIDDAFKYADKILYLGHDHVFFGSCDDYLKSNNPKTFGGGQNK